MPSKQTKNYQLSQWAKSDRVLMDDFNADNAKIDAALKTLDTGLTGKASTSALNSLTSTVNGLKSSKADASALSSLETVVNGKASQTDLNSLKSTVTSLQSAVEKKQSSSSAVKIAVGTYTGDGTYGADNVKTLDLSGQLNQGPSLLVVRSRTWDGDGLIVVAGTQTATPNLSGTVGTGGQVTLTWRNKSVSWYGASARAHMNVSGQLYQWFAIG